MEATDSGVAAKARIAKAKSAAPKNAEPKSARWRRPRSRKIAPRSTPSRTRLCRDGSHVGSVERAFAIAVRLAITLLALVVLTTLGLLVIEQFTATAYQPPPTFADAFLDASSAVAGGGLTSGLTTTVTSRNLSSGIQQRVEVYQYGMAWLA